MMQIWLNNENFGPDTQITMQPESLNPQIASPAASRQDVSSDYYVEGCVD